MVAAKKIAKGKTEETYGIYIKDGWQASLKHHLPKQSYKTE